MKTKTCVEEVSKQDLLDFMGWMRKQPLPKRKHSNPERTYADKIGHVAIFLKEFKVGHGLKKRSEEHTSELQSRLHLVCRLLLEKKNNTSATYTSHAGT